MHIGITLSGLGAGGAERVVALVAGHWISTGHQVTIFTFDRPEDPCFHEFDPAVTLVRLGLPAVTGRRRKVLGMLNRIRDLRASLRAHRPDVLISFLFKINVLSIIASRGLGIPVAACERNHPLLQPAHPIWRELVKVTYPWAKAVVLQTEASRDAMDVSIQHRCIVIGNPVSRFPRRPEPDGMKILSAVGRLEQQKGYDLLIDAFAQIESLHPDWMLYIWGEGPLRNALAERIESLDMTGRIRLAGLSKGPADWIAQSSAFVITSEYEGFGNALAEAGAAGLPRVASWFEFGAREQIQDGVDGILLPHRDKASLANALDRLLFDGQLRQELGAAAAESARRFAPDNILSRWDDLLTLLDDGRAS